MALDLGFASSLPLLECGSEFSEYVAPSFGFWLLLWIWLFTASARIWERIVGICGSQFWISDCALDFGFGSFWPELEYGNEFSESVAPSSGFWMWLWILDLALSGLS